jgi:integrase
MPIKAKELSIRALEAIKKPGLHSVGGCDGLMIQVTPTARTWVLRYRIGDRRRNMGLGGYPTVSLADARRLGLLAREKLRNGIDPLEEKHAARAALVASLARGLTFDQCADKYIEAHRASWRNDKHQQQWTNTIAAYASPIFGKLPIAQVNTPLVLKCLEPIWSEKNETAMRLRGRLEKVFGWATTAGYRTGDNPARWEGHLQNLLANISRKGRTVNRPALHYEEIGAFMADLREREGVSARALELAILCSSRSIEVRGAKWSEFDLKAKTWTVPADRMKAKVEHQVPLSDAAVKLIDALPRDRKQELLFVNTKGTMLSDAALNTVIDRMNIDRKDAGLPEWQDRKQGRAVVPHGFRSTFRMWAAEVTNYPRDVAEHALAHRLPDAVEAAYQRGTLFGKRCKMMAEWANYCDKPLPAKTDNVVPMKGKTAA